ncbi:MAG TPA: methyltransferase domain-containing protein [Blastocatellia bacterium]|nr:methyltransferase domain-containing protein [Blastocatellia bacterium]
MSNESAYIHGTDPEEQARLSLLNDLLNFGSLRELKLQGGERILDVGCGLGQLSRAMARAAGVRVVGIERSAEQIAEAERQAAAANEASLVEFRSGDAMHFPLRADEWGAFDVAHTRFLLEHLREPLPAVQAMVRAVRVGGRIVLEDDDHDLLRLWPEPPGFTALWQAYQRSYEHLGNDPIVGRRLVSLLVEAGAQPVRNTFIFFGSCAGEPHFSLYVENLIGVINGARATVTEAGLLNAASFDEAIAALHEWSRGVAATIWYAMSWAEGQRVS